MFIAITFNDNPVQPQRGDMFTSSIPRQQASPYGAKRAMGGFPCYKYDAPQLCGTGLSSTAYWT